MCTLIFMKHLCYAITWKGRKDKQVKCSHNLHGETTIGKARFYSSLKKKNGNAETQTEIVLSWFRRRRIHHLETSIKLGLEDA